jgi:parvulin-like peptidyl-prolyl isomerase
MNRFLPASVERYTSQRVRSGPRRGRTGLAAGAVALALCAALAATLAGCSAGSDALVVERVDGNAISMTSYQQIVALSKDQNQANGQSADWQSPSGRATLSQIEAGALQFLASTLLYHEQVQQQHLTVTTKDLQAQLTSLSSSVKSAAQQNPSDAEFRAFAQAIPSATAEAAHNPDLAALIAGRASYADVLVMLAYANAEQQVLTAHAKVPTAAVRLIEVNTKQDAQALQTQAQHGADFAALAKAHSLDSATGQQGGNLGKPYFYVGELSQITPALDRAIFGPQVANAKTSYIVVPLDSSKNSKYLLVQVTNRTTTLLSKLNNPSTENSVLGSWASVVLTPSASVQQYVAVDPTPTSAPSSPSQG